MQVLFNACDAQSAKLREMTERRVRFVMRRLTWLVPRASAKLSDVNGPRGGLDKQCQVRLSANGSQTVVITSVAGDWRSAIDNALARAARVLMRRWRRQRDPQAASRQAIAFDH